MRTNDLVGMLATGILPSDRYTLEKRFAQALFGGLLGTVALLIVMYGIRSDMPAMLVTPLFWIKAAFPMAMLGAALLVATRLARPGIDSRAGWFAVATPLAAIWFAAAVLLLTTPADLRLGLILGVSWQTCTLSIVLLSIPTFAGILWAMKGLAPTQLAAAGAAAGLVAGAQAVMIYTLYCVEMAVPFWAVWYVLGMLVPTVAGALAGPRLLRW